MIINLISLNLVKTNKPLIQNTLVSFRAILHEYKEIREQSNEMLEQGVLGKFKFEKWFYKIHYRYL